jgi:hypothetical protein
MTRFGLRLPNHQARLVALAVSYHLSLPGAELDPETLSEYEHGLAEILPEIDAQLGEDSAVVELTPLQAVLLGTAMSSVVSELKMYSVFDTMSGNSGRPRSTAPGFDVRLHELFPRIAEEPSYTAELAEDMTLLRRELPSARAREILKEEEEAALAAQRARKKRWQFWKRA